MIVNLFHRGDQSFFGKYFDKKNSSDVHYNSLIVGIGIVFEQAFTCSKLTIKTLEEGLNLFKVNDKDKKTTSLTSLW